MPLFFPLLIMSESLDKQARASKHCLACGNAKDTSIVVCWTCWKYGENPFKYFKGSLKEFIAAGFLAKK